MTDTTHEDDARARSLNHVRFSLLHESQLFAFMDWIRQQGYIIHKGKDAAKYEVLRIEPYSREGNNPHHVFYKREKSEHITVPTEMVRLVKAFVQETQKPSSRRKNLRKKLARQRRALKIVGGTDAVEVEET